MSDPKLSLVVPNGSATDVADRTATECDDNFILERVPAPCTRPLVDKRTRYSEDVAAQLFVDAFPNGASCAMVAEAMGCSRELGRLLENKAIESVRRRLALVGISAEDFAEAMARKAATEVAW